MRTPFPARSKGLARRLVGTWLNLVSLVVVGLIAITATAQVILPRTEAINEASPRNTRLDALKQQADHLRQEGKNEEALKLWNQIIWLDMDCGQCFAFRSGVLGNLGKFQEGVADGHSGIQRSKTPRDKALGAYNMGFNLEGLNRKSEALSAYNECVKYDATFPMCYFGKGKVLNSMLDYVQGLKALQTATELHPTHGLSRAYKAIAEAALGMKDASLADGNMAVELLPKEPRSYLARAQAWGENGRFDRMREDASKVLELDSTRPGAHFLRGQALKSLGREEEAAREFELEPDRDAVSRFLHPEKHVDLRLYNCGNSSTELQTPANYNSNGFDDCVKRINEQLQEQLREREALTKPKRSVPGLPTRRPVN